MDEINASIIFFLLYLQGGDPCQTTSASGDGSVFLAMTGLCTVISGCPVELTPGLLDPVPAGKALTCQLPPPLRPLSASFLFYSK